MPKTSKKPLEKLIAAAAFAAALASGAAGAFALGPDFRGALREGVDLVNFGAIDSGTVVTVGAGARYRLTDHVQFGAAYETPVTDREDLTDWRVYADLVLTY